MTWTSDDQLRLRGDDEPTEPQDPDPDIEGPDNEIITEGQDPDGIEIPEKNPPETDNPGTRPQ